MTSAMSWVRGTLKVGSWAFVVAANDARSDPCQAPFATDRPTATNGHGTVGAGCFQIETSLNVNRAPDDTGLSFAPLLRFGVGKNFELRLTDELMGIDIPDGHPVQAGARPLTLEMKVMGIAQNDTVPGFGVLVGATVPIGRSAGAQSSVAVSALTDGNIGAGFGYSVNLIGSAVPVSDAAGHRLALSYAAVLSFAPPLKDAWLTFHLDGEGGATVVSHAPWGQSLGGGITANLTSEIQLFALALVTITGDEHPYSIGPGLVVRVR